ncbi:ATP-binding protein [Vitreoscilla filiformis]|nr:ATP-binding protein [Vitreoscilla filiformis]
MRNPPPEMCRVGSVTLTVSDAPQTRREKLARIVLDAMYQFVGLLDAQGRTLEINRSALEGAGIALEDIQGQPFWEARWFQVSQDTVQWQRELVQRAAAGEFIRCDMEIYGQAAGDETIVVDFSLSPVRDDQGRVAFLLAEGRNITAKKQAEAEIARKNAELQALLDRVRQLDQLKSDLFANVSHELRTPLALILGPTEDLLATSHHLSDAQRHQLQVVQRNAATLLKHVNDLLDLARLDARKVGQVDLQPQRLDLAALVRDTAEQFHAVAPQRAVRYTVSAPGTLPAQIDADKFERILLNLLSNAFKFTPPGGRVLCALRRLEGGQALLTVQDSGPGVPPEQRLAVFERFRQLQHGTTRSHGGTGLGLAIAKEFTALHHGSISVSEAPGGGALFQVVLPLEVAAESVRDAAPDATRSPALAGTLAELTLDAPPPDTAAIATPANDAAPDERPTALVVEDNPDMRRFIAQALAGEFRVTAVEDGQRGLEQALATPPDLVLTDLMMPRLGGDQLLEQMRAHPSLADVPALVLSARDDEALRTRLLAEAAQDYLTKPFSAAELRARARNLATMKRARDVLRQALASRSEDLAQLTRRFVVSRRVLQESEYRWWAIYEHSPVGIALLDASGRIRTANPAFRQMVGYGPQEVRACSLQTLTPLEDRAATQARIERLLAGQVSEYHVQRRYQRQNGELVWANTSVALIPDDQPAEPLLLVVAEDITEHKRAEHALARTRHELAQVTRASTLGELAASIAHEVNQPLAAIVTNGHASLRWLDAAPPDETEARAAVQRIIRDANRAGEVITRIRRFLQRGEVAHSALALGAVLADVLALVRSEAQARQISLHLEVAEALPLVMADRVQIEQVLLNLVMNALEALGRADDAPSDAVQEVREVREVHLRALRHSPSCVRLEVADSGPGIAPAVRERLFDAFQTTKPDGMGMGLAISRSIVESHGGRLWVAPNVGAPGVTFSVTLPLHAESSCA